MQCENRAQHHPQQQKNTSTGIYFLWCASASQEDERVRASSHTKYLSAIEWATYNMDIIACSALYRSVSYVDIFWCVCVLFHTIDSTAANSSSQQRQHAPALVLTHIIGRLTDHYEGVCVWVHSEPGMPPSMPPQKRCGGAGE